MKQNTKKILALMMCAAMAAGTLAGCGSSSSSSASESTASSSSSETASSSSSAVSASSSSSTRTITTVQGDTVEVPSPLEHIAFTQWPAGEAITIMLEQQDTLATLSTTNASNELLLEFYPELADLPTTPDISDGNVEEFLANGVQLVYTSSDYNETFENAGIVALNPDFSSPEAIQQTILMMGDAFGDEAYAKAQEYVDYYNGNLERCTAVSDSLSDDERPRVYYAAGGLTNTEGSGSITNSWMEAAGGINVATENGIEGTFIDISAEELLDWDPDVIILRDAEYYDELMNDESLSALTAVQEGRVYVAPKGIYNWAVRASEAAIMPLWAATVINPDLYTDIDIEQETKDFHKTFYGMDLTDEQVQTILDPAGVVYTNAG